MSTFAFSFGSSKRKGLTNNTNVHFPGPGAYGDTFKTAKKKDPQWRFGSSTRCDQEKTMRRTSNFPPPGTYESNFRVSMKKDPSWGFGSSKRGGLTTGKSIAPGCQTYNLRSKAVEGRA